MVSSRATALTVAADRRAVGMGGRIGVTPSPEEVHGRDGAPTRWQDVGGGRSPRPHRNTRTLGPIYRRELDGLGRTETTGPGFRFAFDRQGALLRAERVHYKNDIERQQTHLSTLAKSGIAIENLEVVLRSDREPPGVSDARGSAVGVGGLGR